MSADDPLERACAVAGYFCSALYEHAWQRINDPTYGHDEDKAVFFAVAAVAECFAGAFAEMRHGPPDGWDPSPISDRFEEDESR